MAGTWRCDGCGKPVTENDGYLEWLWDSKEKKAHGFRIIHSGGNDCSAYRSDPELRKRLQDNDLTSVVGENGITRLLSMLDVGAHIDPEYRGPEVRDLREFVEIFRRLQVPHFEEAREKMSDADPSWWPGDNNEVSIYCQDTLRSLIRGEYDN